MHLSERKRHRWMVEEIASLRTELKLLEVWLEEIKAGYNPSQPRVPAGNPDGGQWVKVAPESWNRPETFDKHYKKHGKQVGARSAQDYARQAEEFRKEAQRNKYPTVQKKTGHIKVYDPKTNRFGVYSPDGKTETYYKPRSRTYYERQVQHELQRGGRVIHPLPSKTPPPPRSGRGGGGGFGGFDSPIDKLRGPLQRRPKM